jgi:hypothetical protein
MAALLLVLPSAAALSASTGIVQAVEECRLDRGWPAPSGSKWLSRINRDQRRCWFLSSKVVGSHHTQSPRAGPVRSRHFAGDTDLGQVQRRDDHLQAASTAIGKTDVAVAAEAPAVLQSTTPSVGQSSANLAARSVPTIAYKVLRTTTETVVAPTIGAARVAERAPAGASTTNLVLLVGAAGAALLFAGGTFHFTRQIRRSSARAATRTTRGQPLLDHQSLRSGRLTNDPADDLKRSVLELKRADLVSDFQRQK